MNMISIVLHFAGNSSVELIRSEFRDMTRDYSRVCVRGKASDSSTNEGSFQWTSGVRAMCAVFLRFAIADREQPFGYCLQGGRGSLASSLDYALSKSPTWLLEMFGAGPQGTPYARRLFRISNPNRKRPGPVVISVNNHLLENDSVRIVLDGTPVVDPEQLRRLLDSVENVSGDETDPAPSSSSPRLILC